MKTRFPEVNGYTGNSPGNASINAPINANGENTYLSVRVFLQSYFDSELCAAVCSSLTGRVSPNFVRRILLLSMGDPSGSFVPYIIKAETSPLLPML